jgi:hypothetical protein
MAPKTKNEPVRAAVLRAIGLALPDVDEGIACAGTSLEARTLRRRGKAFLFLGAKEVRLKLADSLPEATALARKAPAACQAGANGWVRLAVGAELPRSLLERWIAESHAAVAGGPKAARPRPGKGRPRAQQAR